MMLTIMTYNIHGGKDIKDNLTIYGISNFIKQSKADVIGL
ncbi:endonuclease/exonuclease/phosphatase family protein [Thermoanaerobacterium thermosaccharolyticum]